MIYQGKNFAIDLAKVCAITGIAREPKSDQGVWSIYQDGSNDPILVTEQDGLKILEAWKQLHAPKPTHDEDLELLAEWCDTCWDMDLGNSIRKRAWRTR